MSPWGGVSLDDYLLRGPDTALSVVEEITGAPQVNVAGLCIGGTLTAMLLAQFAGAGADSGSLRDAPEHPGRLQRARPTRRVRGREGGVRPGAEDGAEGLPRRCGDRPDLQRPPRERSDLELCREQLADGRAAPRVRHPRVERRQHQASCGPPLLLPPLVLRRQRASHAGSSSWTERGSTRPRSRPTCTCWRRRMTTSRRGVRASRRCVSSRAATSASS